MNTNTKTLALSLFLLKQSSPENSTSIGISPIKMMKKKSIRIASSPSSSSPQFPYNADSLLPIDLLINILARLQVKSLSKLKCVSKKWFNIIADPHFLSTHRELCRSNPNKVLVKMIPLIWNCTRLDISTVSFDGFHKNLEFSVYIMNYVVGQIEMLPSKWDLICFRCCNVYYVCNPSTGAMVKLPERDEHVLVHLFHRRQEEEEEDEDGVSQMLCEVLRLRDGTDCLWKLVDAVCPYYVRGWGVMVENVFYWIIWNPVFMSDEVGEEGIVLFDLEKEDFGFLSLPEGCSEPDDNWSLVELGGRLCLVVNAMDIWALKDTENHKWVHEHSIHMDGYTLDSLDLITPFYDQDEIILIDANGKKYTPNGKKYTPRINDDVIAEEWRVYIESFFSFRTR